MFCFARNPPRGVQTPVRPRPGSMVPRISAQVSTRRRCESHSRTRRTEADPSRACVRFGRRLGPHSLSPCRACPVRGQCGVEHSHFSPTPRKSVKLGLPHARWLGDEPEDVAGSSWIWGPTAQPSGMELPRQAPDRPPEATCAPSSGRPSGFSSTCSDASELLSPLGWHWGPHCRRTHNKWLETRKRSTAFLPDRTLLQNL